MCMYLHLGFSHVTQAGLKPSYVAEEGIALISCLCLPSARIMGMPNLSFPAVLPFLFCCACFFVIVVLLNKFHVVAHTCLDIAVV